MSKNKHRKGGKKDMRRQRKLMYAGWHMAYKAGMRLTGRSIDVKVGLGFRGGRIKIEEMGHTCFLHLLALFVNEKAFWKSILSVFVGIH
ncbi:hypothetical protein CEXT_759241 [Caerostris extrusa]|uniref:Uncharacterized protein n=1 Tax=Caerostris extrusa TaxID=172846 RepID=A0AAV4P3Y3_CAEEX|nr:hypothetical protein CEXT_759241 [Caerostris extrusa]